MAQIKTDRSPAAKKAVALRERDRSMAQSEAPEGTAVGMRQGRAAGEAASQAKRAAASAMRGAAMAARLRALNECCGWR